MKINDEIEIQPRLTGILRERIYLEILDNDLSLKINEILSISNQKGGVELLNDIEKEHVLNLISVRSKIFVALKGVPRTSNN